MVYLYYTNWVRNQLAAEAYRSKLDLKEAELKEYKTTIESLEERYTINHYMYIRNAIMLYECLCLNCSYAQSCLLVHRLRNQPCDANTLNDKFQEQLVQTNQQLKTKWMKVTKEKDERLHV